CMPLYSDGGLRGAQLAMDRSEEGQWLRKKVGELHGLLKAARREAATREQNNGITLEEARQLAKECVASTPFLATSVAPAMDGMPGVK
ncbi:hypothetical protein CYMTET_17559, partial [Cymbomonas tetramitiformis]